MTFLRMSIIGAVLIVLITAVRALLQHKLDRRVFLLLWSIAVLRLLIPIFVPSPFVPSRLAVPSRRETTVSVVIHQPTDEQGTSAAPPAAVSGKFHSAEATTLLRFLWFGGALLLAAIFAINHLRNHLKNRFSLPLPEHLNVPDGLRVRMLDGLEAPLTYGIFRPTVLLPCDLSWCDEDQLCHILLHEQAHIRHHDVLKKLFLLLTLCLHWFNPAVWLMFYLASQDMEMRCDAEVISTLGVSSRLSYAHTLVAAERSRLTGILQTGFSFSSMAERLNAIAKGRVCCGLSIALGIALISFSLFGFLTAEVSADEAAAVPAELPTSAVTEFLPPVTTPTPVSVKPAEEPTQPETTEPETTETTETTAAILSSEESTEPVFSAWTESGDISIAFQSSADIMVFSTADCSFVSDAPDVVPVHYYIRWDGQSAPSAYTVSLRSVNKGEPAGIYACYEGNCYYICSASPIVGTSSTDYGFSSDSSWFDAPGLDSPTIPTFPIIDLETGYVVFP